MSLRVHAILAGGVVVVAAAGGLALWLLKGWPEAGGVWFIVLVIVGARFLGRFPMDVPGWEKAHSDVWVAVGALTDPGNIDPGDVVDAMTSTGMSRVAAERLLAFVPIGFGRVMLEDLGFSRLPQGFSVRSSDGDWLVHKLRREPYYMAALHVGFHMLNEWDRNTMIRVAGQSPEVKAVEDSLDEGRSLEELTSSLVFTEPWLARLTAEEWLADPATGRSRRP